MVAPVTSRNPGTSVQAAAEPPPAVPTTPPPAIPSIQPATSTGTTAHVILPDEPAGTGEQVPQGAMPISSGSSQQTVKAYLGQNAGQPKMAVTREGTTLLVYGTSTAANGQTMVETSAPQSFEGGTAWTPLATFDKDVAVLDPGTAAKGTQLTPLSGQGFPAPKGGIQANQTYTFNAFYKDPTTGQPMASLTDGSGKNVNVKTSDMNSDFGNAAMQDLVHNSLTPTAQSSMITIPNGGSSGTQGYSVGLSSTSQDVGNWLQQGQYPALANANNGKTYLIDGVNTDSTGNTTVTVEDPSSPSSGTFNISLSSATEDFHYFDRGTSGVGTPFSATGNVGNVEAGEKYTYKGMSIGPDGQAQVDLTDSKNLPVSLPVSQFSQAFGATAMQNLMNSSRANPAEETSAPSGATYASVPNSELFAASTNATGLQQGDYEGDCYLTSSMVSLARQNPQALKQMVRPSTDGNPNDYDVRFYLPQNDGSFKPVWVTVNDQLATLPNGKPAGQNTPIDPATGKPQIGYALIEKAYAQLNQQYGTQSQNGGYSGIAGGDPSRAMEYLTGQPNHEVMAASSNSNQLWQSLSQANSGHRRGGEHQGLQRPFGSDCGQLVQQPRLQRAGHVHRPEDRAEDGGAAQSLGRQHRRQRQESPQ